MENTVLIKTSGNVEDISVQSNTTDVKVIIVEDMDFSTAQSIPVTLNVAGVNAVNRIVNMKEANKAKIESKKAVKITPCVQRSEDWFEIKQIKGPGNQIKVTFSNNLLDKMDKGKLKNEYLGDYKAYFSWKDYNEENYYLDLYIVSSDDNIDKNYHAIDGSYHHISVKGGVSENSFCIPINKDGYKTALEDKTLTETEVTVKVCTDGFRFQIPKNLK
jgi:hypothetical protein